MSRSVAEDDGERAAERRERVALDAEEGLVRGEVLHEGELRVEVGHVGRGDAGRGARQERVRGHVGLAGARLREGLEREDDGAQLRVGAAALDDAAERVGGPRRRRVVPGSRRGVRRAPRGECGRDGVVAGLVAHDEGREDVVVDVAEDRRVRGPERRARDVAVQRRAPVEREHVDGGLAGHRRGVVEAHVDVAGAQGAPLAEEGRELRAHGAGRVLGFESGGREEPRLVVERPPRVRERAHEGRRAVGLGDAPGEPRGLAGRPRGGAARAPGLAARGLGAAAPLDGAAARLERGRAAELPVPAVAGQQTPPPVAHGRAADERARRRGAPGDEHRARDGLRDLGSQNRARGARDGAADDGAAGDAAGRGPGPEPQVAPARVGRAQLRRRRAHRRGVADRRVLEDDERARARRPARRVLRLRAAAPPAAQRGPHGDVRDRRRGRAPRREAARRRRRRRGRRDGAPGDVAQPAEARAVRRDAAVETAARRREGAPEQLRAAGAARADDVGRSREGVAVDRVAVVDLRDERRGLLRPRRHNVYQVVDLEYESSAPNIDAISRPSLNFKLR